MTDSKEADELRKQIAFLTGKYLEKMVCFILQNKSK